MQRKFKTIAFLSLVALFSNAYCDDTPSGEAITACADKEDGDVCEFVNKNGEALNGFCRIKSANGEGKLICVPSQ